jgi:hypothetical protein
MEAWLKELWDGADAARQEPAGDLEVAAGGVGAGAAVVEVRIVLDAPDAVDVVFREGALDADEEDGAEGDDEKLSHSTSLFREWGNGIALLATEDN